MEAVKISQNGIPSITPDDFNSEINKILKEANQKKGLLYVRSMNECIEEAKSRPIPNMLFDEFFNEGEVCILYADTNVGKSILSVQIADSISRGHPISGFKMEAEKQPVIYCDFELSDKQIENRYSVNFSNHYHFDDNLTRVEISQDSDIPENMSFEEYLYVSLERTIIDTKAKILIVDNITYLKNETEKAKDAIPLMKLLKALKVKYDLSILVLAHTPKRDMSKPISRNDLSGSKMLINFCDSAFAIGESNSDINLRYLKQIKNRAREMKYDIENVCLCQIVKHVNFLCFEFIGFAREREHLKVKSDKDMANLQEQVYDYHVAGKSYREIGRELGISHMKAKRIIEKMESQKQV